MQRTTTLGAAVDIGAGVRLASQDAPLKEFTTLDEVASSQDEVVGKRQLTAPCEQTVTAAVARHDGRRRHSDLAAVALALESNAHLFVLARRTWKAGIQACIGSNQCNGSCARCTAWC